MSKQIFMLFSCGEDITHGIENLMMVTTSAYKMKNFIAKEIRSENVEYGNIDKSPKDQAKDFVYDWTNKTRYEINSKLRYAQYDYVIDGEKI